MRYLFLSALLLLSACATTQDQNIRYYQPAVIPDNAAQLVGSRVVQNFPSNDQIAFVIGLDGEFVKGKSSSYAQPVLLAPGEHTVTVVWTQGRLFGQTLFRLSAVRGAQYTIRHQAGEEHIVRIWIEDAQTRTPTSEPVLVKVSSLGNVPFRPFFSHAPR